jgi:predicted site-specific integrase-resolvase
VTINIKGHQYYRTAEACALASISKNTFLRWVRDGIFADVLHRDRRGWRLFTEEDLQRLKEEANKTS